MVADVSRGSQSSRPQVGDYIKLGLIGKGSFAKVYQGYQTTSKQMVAIKEVDIARLNNKLKENLYGEILTLKTLRHPHIVALHDSQESNTHINLIMEYCELGDLSQFIKKRDKLTTHVATRDMVRKYPNPPKSGLHEVIVRHFLKQLSSALEFLRNENYIHRDIKPQNLLLLPSQAMRNLQRLPIMEASRGSLVPVAGVPSMPMLKLADFGFARLLPSTSLAETLCGSPLYMAPEILRYERYDAKADLWSVGAVLYEMSTGRAPFNAKNHVELLRNIEHANDKIVFPERTKISPEMQSLIKSLLKRNPVERSSFNNFFNHPVVAGEIVGLVEDDIPTRPSSSSSAVVRDEQPRVSSEALPSSPRVDAGFSRSYRDQQSRTPLNSTPAAQARTPRPSLDSGRPGVISRGERSNSNARRPLSYHAPTSITSQARVSEVTPRRTLSTRDPPRRADPRRATTNFNSKEEEETAQDMMFERDYVVVERRHVEVNALADELAANERLGDPSRNSNQGGLQLVRRQTQPAGLPPSPTSLSSTPTSRTALVTQGHDRRSSNDRAMSVSPTSSPGTFTKVIQEARLRLFGIKVPPLPGTSRGLSPPMYQPFPAYPTPPSAGLLGDVKNTPSADEDVVAAQTIEELATRSDCVYGFAEVKYKQLVPLVPSAEQGLGGVDAAQLTAEEDGLTVEAEVGLSEEALVLYVKSLSLLARAMDIASIWWSKKTRAESVSPPVAQRINAVVQWVRGRFNEVLEKTDIVRLKLVQAQKLLPEDHLSHPSNHAVESVPSASGPGFNVYLTPGIKVEKLMYDRAVDMSRAAAIDEVTNENLDGCELSYITAIRMLEAVLDSDDNISLNNSSSNTKETISEANVDLNSDDRDHIKNMIKMITGRLAQVRNKKQMIAEANRAQHGSSHLARRRSGEVKP